MISPSKVKLDVNTNTESSIIKKNPSQKSHISQSKGKPKKKGDDKKLNELMKIY